MALTIKRPKQGETDELPEDEIEDQDQVENEDADADADADVDADEDDGKGEDEVTRLKIENAEQRGRLSVLQNQAGVPKNDPRTVLQQTKAQVFADANNLSDEDFEGKYRMAKHLATASILEQQSNITEQENKRLNAEARAEAELSARYGADFYRFKGRIEESLEDLSDAARQDPKRLAKHMERQLKSYMVSKPKSRVEDRKKVVQDFDAPQPAGKKPEEKLKKSDDIKEEDRSLANAMGLKSESERLKYMNPFVEMNMGDGLVFRDPAKGFEKVEPPVAATA